MYEGTSLGPSRLEPHGIGMRKRAQRTARGTREADLARLSGNNPHQRRLVEGGLSAAVAHEQRRTGLRSWGRGEGGRRGNT
jgi:hypothetical protein